jgi:glutamine amidotransferase
LYEEIEDGCFFYFVHSYYADPAEARLIAGRTSYGTEYASAVARGRVAAVQFHPEKSQHDGLRLFRNFGRWMGLVARH